MADTKLQYDEVIATCRDLYIKKMADYGPSWRISRPQTITDQIFINAKRIRTIQINGEAKIDDDIYSEYIGIVNYGVIGMIQLEKGFSDTIDMTREEAIALYDKYIAETKALMVNKNTDPLTVLAQWQIAGCFVWLWAVHSCSQGSQKLSTHGADSTSLPNTVMCTASRA